MSFFLSFSSTNNATSSPPEGILLGDFDTHLIHLCQFGSKRKSNNNKSMRLYIKCRLAVLICINSPIDKSSTCVFFRVEIKVSLLSVDSIIRRFSLLGKQIRTQMSRINAHKGQLKCKFSTAENGDNQSRMCVCLCVCMCL